MGCLNVNVRENVIAENNIVKRKHWQYCKEVEKDNEKYERENKRQKIHLDCVTYVLLGF
jgi:hypothetical protein